MMRLVQAVCHHNRQVTSNPRPTTGTVIHSPTASSSRPELHRTRPDGAPASKSPTRSKQVRRNAAYGADLVKLSTSGEEITGNKHAEDNYFSDEEVPAPTTEAHRRGLRVCSHARSAESVKMSLRNNVDLICHAGVIDAGGRRPRKTPYTDRPTAVSQAGARGGGRGPRRPERISVQRGIPAPTGTSGPRSPGRDR
jgi:hypothetical protein